ncbi:MAG: hypothetical protein VYE22_03750 [Myxococcota bacterium]|nr:hypothetical protein [Myxococcota bacterium]
MVALDRLVALVPPRASAHRATVDDAEIVRAFGTSVPSDYLSLVEAADGWILPYFRAVRSGGAITCQVLAPLLEATRARLNAAVLAGT